MNQRCLVGVNGSETCFAADCETGGVTICLSQPRRTRSFARIGDGPWHGRRAPLSHHSSAHARVLARRVSQARKSTLSH